MLLSGKDLSFTIIPSILNDAADLIIDPIFLGSVTSSNAIKLIEFLLSKEAQDHIVNNTFEYPMIENVLPNELVPGKDLNFKQDNSTDVKLYWDKQSEALKIMLLAGWK